MLWAGIILFIASCLIYYSHIFTGVLSLIVGVILLASIVLIIVGSVRIRKAKEERERQAIEQHKKEMLALTVNLDYVKLLGVRTYHTGGNIHISEYGTSVNINESSANTVLFVYKDGHQFTREITPVDMHYFDNYIRA